MASIKKIIVFCLALTFVCVVYAVGNFQLFFTGAKVSQAEEEIMLRGAIYISDFYRIANFPIDIRDIRIRVFDSFEEYKKYQENNSSAKSDNGYYSSSNKELVLCKNKKFIKTFFHELNHYLLRSRISSPPKWINEGLSEYFEGLRLTSQGIVSVHLQNNKINRIKEWLKGDIYNELRGIISATNDQWSKQSFGPDYRSPSFSYAIIVFILSRENGKEMIGTILKNLLIGKSSREAVSLSYPGGFDKFESDFVRFYENYSI